MLPIVYTITSSKNTVPRSKERFGEDVAQLVIGWNINNLHVNLLSINFLMNDSMLQSQISQVTSSTNCLSNAFNAFAIHIDVSQQKENHRASKH